MLTHRMMFIQGLASPSSQSVRFHVTDKKQIINTSHD